jgi:hypothetical protein
LYRVVEKVARRTIRFVLQLSLALKQFAFGVELKGDNGGFVNLTALQA